MNPPLDRSLFPVTGSWAYLNHASTAPLPQPSVDATMSWAGECAMGGSFSYPVQADRTERIRAAAAGVLGVSAPEVAFVKNTTEGLSFVANGLGLGEGDRVVLPDLEFPSTAYPWLALRDQGVLVDLVPPSGPPRATTVDRFAEVVRAGPPPQVVATSWVQYGRGWRTDLEGLAGLCHDVGALLCVDVIQGLGVIPARLDHWGVDFAVADGHKWLLGPSGIGVMSVRASQLHRLRPQEPGWSSVLHRGDYDNLDLVFADDARRLEGGSANYLGIAALGVSIDLLQAAGVGAVWEHVSRLCDRLVEGLRSVRGVAVLSDRSASASSGIVSFTVDGLEPAEACSALMDAGVVCSTKTGAVRASPHGYNTADEIDLLVEVVAGISSAAAR